MWGLAGGFVVEALNLVASIRQQRTWPWQVPGEIGATLYLICSLLRLAVSTIVAGALGADDQVSGAAGAFLIGVGAPLIIRATLAQIGAVSTTSLEPTADSITTMDAPAPAALPPPSGTAGPSIDDGTDAVVPDRDDPLRIGSADV
ncbi:hypothetical protein Pen02_81250 [Plantactinospora endophytica]|uniref:DUF1453 domain-containing protein n=2 Tax=Plantactinospora endophytica TaxID=673535 RepID=A0ABQ4EEN8_9ACTN|nr:hypothetical protein Pen02_81250 [Plantactinospora endophytica]